MQRVRKLLKPTPKTILACTLLVVFGVTLWWLWKFVWWVVDPASAFSGDAKITDTGFFTYPRFHVHLPTIAANQTNNYVFSLRRMPRARYYFGLVLDGAGKTPGTVSESRRIKVGVKIKDDRDNVLCATDSPLSAWHESRSQTRTLYWHESCRDVAMSPYRVYSVELSLEAEGSLRFDSSLTPVFEGGGNETP
jgi:hypothetical protein